MTPVELFAALEAIVNDLSKVHAGISNINWPLVCKLRNLESAGILSDRLADQLNSCIPLLSRTAQSCEDFIREATDWSNSNGPKFLAELHGTDGVAAGLPLRRTGTESNKKDAQQL